MISCLFSYMFPTTLYINLYIINGTTSAAKQDTENSLHAIFAVFMSSLEKEKRRRRNESTLLPYSIFLLFHFYINTHSWMPCANWKFYRSHKTHKSINLTYNKKKKYFSYIVWLEMSFQLSARSSWRWNFSRSSDQKQEIQLKSLWRGFFQCKCGRHRWHPFSPLSLHSKGIGSGLAVSYVRVPNISAFLCLQFTQRMVVCKSELVRDGDFRSYVIMYSYLFVGVGLAQKFKPITIFTRDFQLFLVHKLLSMGNFIW